MPMIEYYWKIINSTKKHIAGNLLVDPHKVNVATWYIPRDSLKLGAANAKAMWGGL